MPNQSKQEDESKSNTSLPTENDRTDFTREDWETLASDPELERDFGYTFEEWEIFETADNSNSLIFLPSDEKNLKNDEYCVVAEETLVDLENRY